MCITPMLVEKMKGLYRMNLAGYILGTAGRVGVIFAGYMGSVPLMLAFTAVAALGMAPWQGDMGAVVASCSEYTYLTKHKHIDGTMYSCTSFGTKSVEESELLFADGYLSKWICERVSNPARIMLKYASRYVFVDSDGIVIGYYIYHVKKNVEDANKKLGKQLEER